MKTIIDTSISQERRDKQKIASKAYFERNKEKHRIKCNILNFKNILDATVYNKLIEQYNITELCIEHMKLANLMSKVDECRQRILTMPTIHVQLV